MQFITMVLGGPGNSVLTMVLGLGFVLVLVGLGAWVLRAGMRRGSMPGRMQGRRLSVVEQLQIDPRRQVVIIRRDDVEHVLLIGGAQDVVIESNIPADVARKVPVAHPAPARPVPTLATVGGAPSAASTGAAPAASGAPRAHMERLRELARPTAIRNWRSLRHTGLLRPVATAEAAVIQLPPVAADTTGRLTGASPSKPRGVEDERTPAALKDQRPGQPEGHNQADAP